MRGAEGQLAAQVLPHLPVPAHTAADRPRGHAVQGLQRADNDPPDAAARQRLHYSDLSALAVFYVIGARIRKTSTGGSSAMGVI